MNEQFNHKIRWMQQLSGLLAQLASLNAQIAAHLSGAPLPDGVDQHIKPGFCKQQAAEKQLFPEQPKPAFKYPP